MTKARRVFNTLTFDRSDLDKVSCIIPVGHPENPGKEGIRLTYREEMLRNPGAYRRNDIGMVNFKDAKGKISDQDVVYAATDGTVAWRGLKDCFPIEKRQELERIAKAMAEAAKTFEPMKRMLVTPEPQELEVAVMANANNEVYHPPYMHRDIATAMKESFSPKCVYWSMTSGNTYFLEKDTKLRITVLNRHGECIELYEPKFEYDFSAKDSPMAQKLSHFFAEVECHINRGDWLTKEEKAAALRK